MKERLFTKILLSVLICLLVFLADGCINIGCCGPKAKVEKEERLSIRAAPLTTLSAETSFGSISVQGADTDQCEVIAKITAQACTTERAKEILSNAKLKLEPSGETLKVFIDKPSLNNNESVFASYEITLPGKMNVVCQTSFGKIKLAQIQDGVDAHTSFDSITAEDIAGSVKLSTSYGNITCKNVTPTMLRIKSSFGSININCSDTTLPALQANVETSYGNVDFKSSPSFSGKVDMQTSFGNIKTDLPITVKGQIGKDRISGQIGQGKGKLFLKTSFGSIRLR